MVNIWQDYLYPLLQSQALLTIITTVAALAAFIIYYLRRRDYKRDAANIVLLEIQNAERLRSEAKKVYIEGKRDNPKLIRFPEKLRLMPTESWTKYKYLFVRELDPDQWEEISQFYTNCILFDEALEHKDSSFRLNEAEIRSNIQRNIADYAKELASEIEPNPNDDPNIAADNERRIQETKTKKEMTIDLHIRTLIDTYTPDKPYNDAEYYYNLIPENISRTQTGQSLKRLSRTQNKKSWQLRKK